jgi:two-component system NtrC family sensor kinase
MNECPSVSSAQSSAGRFRRGLPALAVLLALSVLTLGAASFLRKMESFQPIGFQAHHDRGVWRVESVADPSTGLQPDDQILAVNQNSPDTSRELATNLRSKAQSEVVVLRNGDLQTLTYDRPALDLDLPYLILALIGFGYLAIGLFTLMRDSRPPAALFFLWTLVSSAVYMITPAAPLDALGKTLYVVEELGRLLLPPLTLQLFLIFPSPLNPWKRFRPWRSLLYVPAAFLLLVQADLIFFHGALLAGNDLGAAIQTADRLELYHLVVFAALAVAVLAHRLRRETQPEQRRQISWITIGLAGGYAPFILLYVAPLAAGVHTPELLNAFAVLPLGLVPLTFAYAILRYRLWDIGGIVRNGVSIAVTVLLGVFSFSIANLLISRAIPPDLAMARQLIAFLTGIGIWAVMVPTRRSISAAIERLQYGGSFSKRRALRELGRELLHERDLNALGTHLVEHLSEALELERAALLLIVGQRLQPLPQDSRIPRSLRLDELEDEYWRRPVSRLSGVAMPRRERSAAQELFLLGYRYVFPLSVRKRRIGALLVSHKEQDTPLSSADLELIRSLTQQTALAIENATLLDEVRQRLDQVVQLQEYTERILESSPAGIAVLDRDDHILSANQAFAELVDRRREALAGEPLTSLLHLDSIPRPGEGLQEAHVQMNGEDRYLQLSAARLEPGEDDAQSLLIVQDVSDRVAMESALKERERLVSLGMLAAGVAHEVNTPITGISSYAQMLLSETQQDDPRYDLLKKVEKQTFRASRIVNSLLDFSRDRPQQKRPLELTPIIESALDLLTDRVRKNGVEVNWSPPTESIRVFGEEGQVDQVITNLIANAVDAMPQGGALSLRVEADDQWIRVTVQDTGAGMTADQLEKIFQPFFSTKRGQGGTGLGLSISYNIVKRLGGEIRVVSEPGEGSRFILELPRHS